MRVYKSLVKAEIIHVFRSFRIGLILICIVISIMLFGLFYSLSSGEHSFPKIIIMFMIPCLIFPIMSQQLINKLFYTPKQESTIISLLASQISPVLIWFSKVTVLFIFIYIIYIVTSITTSLVICFFNLKPFFMVNNLYENIIYFILAPLLCISFMSLEGCLFLILRDQPLAKNIPILLIIGLFIITIRIGKLDLFYNISYSNIILFTVLFTFIFFLISIFVLNRISKDHLI